MKTNENNNRVWRTSIGLRLTPEMGKRFVAACEKENRTMSNYIEKLIMDHFGGKP